MGRFGDLAVKNFLKGVVTLAVGAGAVHEMHAVNCQFWFFSIRSATHFVTKMSSVECVM